MSETTAISYLIQFIGVAAGWAIWYKTGIMTGESKGYERGREHGLVEGHIKGHNDCLKWVKSNQKSTCCGFVSEKGICQLCKKPTETTEIFRFN